MRHAETIAEWVSYLGGEPLAQARPFKVGKTVKEILEVDKMEVEAIRLFKQIIGVAKDARVIANKNLLAR
jgi:bacterioferritin (cytochrome b1)